MFNDFIKELRSKVDTLAVEIQPCLRLYLVIALQLVNIICDG